MILRIANDARLTGWPVLGDVFRLGLQITFWDYLLKFIIHWATGAK